MQVTFLGTGSAMPSASRAQTGILLEDDGNRLLVDCGAGILQQIERADVGHENVDVVLLTHHHLDHVADLLPLLKARWLSGETRTTVAGPAGTEDLLDSLLDVFDYLREEITVRTVEVSPDSFEVGGFEVDAMEARHSAESLAYRFEGVFVFSGDTEAFDDLATFADRCAVLAHDCSFPDGVDVSNHPTPTKLARAVAGHRIGRIYLTHLYPMTRGKEEAMVETVGEDFDGDVRIAEDLLTVSIE